MLKFCLKWIILIIRGGCEHLVFDMGFYFLPDYGVVFLVGAGFVPSEKSMETGCRRHGVRIFPNGLMKSAVIKGEYDGVPVSVISEPQMDEDHRGQRFRTIVQCTIGKGMPAEGVIGSQSMRDFVTDLPFSEEFVLEADKWNEHSIIRTDDAAALDSYFTPQRVVALNALMSIKGLI